MATFRNPQTLKTTNLIECDKLTLFEKQSFTRFPNQIRGFGETQKVRSSSNLPHKHIVNGFNNRSRFSKDSRTITHKPKAYFPTQFNERPSAKRDYKTFNNSGKRIQDSNHSKPHGGVKVKSKSNTNLESKSFINFDIFRDTKETENNNQETRQMGNSSKLIDEQRRSHKQNSDFRNSNHLSCGPPSFGKNKQKLKFNFNQFNLSDKKKPMNHLSSKNSFNKTLELSNRVRDHSNQLPNLSLPKFNGNDTNPRRIGQGAKLLDLRTSIHYQLGISNNLAQNNLDNYPLDTSMNFNMQKTAKDKEFTNFKFN